MKKLPVGDYKNFSLYLRGEDEYYAPALGNGRYYRTLGQIKRAIDIRIRKDELSRYNRK